MPEWPGFIGGSSPGTSLVQDAERTINLYVERMEGAGGKVPQALYPVPGYTAWSSGVTTVGTRGMCAAGTRRFAVIGNTLWEFNDNGAATSRGTVAVDGNPAQMVYGGVTANQLGICSGGAVYSFALGTNILSATALVSGYTHLGFAHGYGVAFNPTTGRAQLSSLNDLATYGLATFLQRSRFPDPWQAMFVDQNSLIWLIGTESFEVWYDTGQGTQPFAVLDGLNGLYGIAAPFAYAVTQYGNLWLGLSRGPRVVLAGGGTPSPISTYAINTELARFRRTATIANAEAVINGDNGHTWVTFSFPSVTGSDIDTPSMTVDVESRSWSHRGEWDTGTGQYGIWAPRAIGDWFGWPVCGDRVTGTIWRLDPTVSTDRNGNGIRRLRQSPGLTDEHKRHPINRIELLMDVGVAGQDLDPQVILQMAQDGGVTFGNQRQAGWGRVGQYRKRVFWTRLGAPADAVARVVWSDAAPSRVLAAWINNQEIPSDSSPLQERAA